MVTLIFQHFNYPLSPDPPLPPRNDGGRRFSNTPPAPPTVPKKNREFLNVKPCTKYHYLEPLFSDILHPSKTVGDLSPQLSGERERERERERDQYLFVIVRLLFHEDTKKA